MWSVSKQAAASLCWENTTRPQPCAAGQEQIQQAGEEGAVTVGEREQGTAASPKHTHLTGPAPLVWAEERQIKYAPEAGKRPQERLWGSNRVDASKEDGRLLLLLLLVGSGMD